MYACQKAVCKPVFVILTTVAGVDYEAVDGEELVFNRGDQRVCHTIVILNDNILEYPPNENFFSNVKFLSGVQPIIVDPQTAEVVIDDSSEQGF